MISDRRSLVHVRRMGMETTKLGLWAIARKRFKRLGRSQFSGIAEIFDSMKFPRFDIICFEVSMNSKINHVKVSKPRRTFWQIDTFRRQYLEGLPQTIQIISVVNQLLHLCTLGIQEIGILRLRSACGNIVQIKLAQMPKECQF